MSFIDGNGGLSAADVAAVTGNNGFGGFGGDGAWWLIILLLFFNNGNWGNNYGGANGMMQQADVQRGFDQASIMNNFTGLENRIDTNQNALMQQLYAMAMAQQTGACENRAATADLKYTVASESATTRAADQANTQKIMDKLCELELAGVRQNYENRIAGMQNQIDALTAQVNNATRASEINASTAQILADNARQTVALEQHLNPTAVPAYIVQNPNCCAPIFSGSCGCGN